MASSPANNAIGIEQQAAGENLNTWGSPKLNQDKQILVNMIVGFTALAVVGNTTIVETNYSASNTTETAVLQLTAGNGLSAAYSVTMPARTRRLLVWNNSGYTATLKLATSTGFALPTGRWTWVVTDGSTDVYNLGSNYGGVSSPINTGDIPTWGAVETAIASAGVPASNGAVLNSGTDTTAGYLSQKVDISVTGILNASWATENQGANEKQKLIISDSPLRRRAYVLRG